MTDVAQSIQDALDQVEEGFADERIFIGAMAKLLDRYEHTVRRWFKESEAIYDIVGEVPEGKGFLPHDLWPEREKKGTRQRLYWWPDQVEGMREFAALKELRRGWHGSRRG